MKKFINLDDIPDYDAPARNIQPSAKPTRSGSGEGNRIVVRQVKPVPKSYMEMYIKEDAPARAEAKSREDGLKVIQNVAKGPMRKPVEDDRYENISEQQTSVSPRGGPSPRSPRSPRSHNALKRNQVVSPPPSDDEYSLRDSIDQLPHYAHALNRNGPVNASPPAPPMRAMPQKKPSPKKQVANGSPVHYKYRDYEDTNDDDDNDSYGDVYASPTTAVVPKHQEKKAPMPVAKAAAPLAQNNRLQRYASPVVTQSSKPKPMPVAKVSPPPAAPAVKEHPIESAEDMLCYSKQPRPVVYKYVHPTNGLSSIMFLVDRPYTLNQYRNIRANEYVEIPKLKPGTACVP